MSLRNLRKIHGDNVLPKPENSSDEEYEPLYAKNTAKAQFSNMLLSSHSESGEGTPERLESEENEEVKVEKFKKKKKKGRKSKKNKSRAALKSKGFEELDEIDKSVMEVNALLGAPPPAPVLPEIKVDIEKVLFGLNSRNLNVSNELRRLFGPELDEEVKRRGRVPNLRRCQKPVIISGPSVFPRSAGPTLSLKNRENGYSYFRFDHSREYQKQHLTFLLLTDHRLNNTMFTPIDDSFMHLEARLEAADFLFIREEYGTANSLIEQMISYMQTVFHPTFNLCDIKTRLEYKYMENRPFFIAILKYIHLLTNRACHRTALELAKMLLNMDPSDPLAILFIIDTLALRAREHQWFISTVEYWSKDKDAEYMFNIQYSYAMAKYHVALKDSSVDPNEATKLLQKAILRFPLVAIKILEIANENDNSRLSAHPLYRLRSVKPGKGHEGAIFLVHNLHGFKMGEQIVMEWLLKTMTDMADMYDQQVEIQEEVRKLANQNFSLFRQVPDQIQRHLCIIKPMSNLLVDGAVPDVPITRFSDPLPPINTIDRYGYTKLSNNYSTLKRLLGSVIPGSPEAQRNLQRNPGGEPNRRPENVGALIASFFSSFQIRSDNDNNVHGNDHEHSDDDLSD